MAETVTYEVGPFVVTFHDVSEAKIQSILTMMELYLDAFLTQFFSRLPETAYVDVYGTYEEYEARFYEDMGHAPDTPYGYFLDDAMASVINLEMGTGPIVHEMVHPLLSSDFPDAPHWFDEGLASLFEDSELTPDGYAYGTLNWRMEDVRERLEGDPSIHLEDALRAEWEDFFGQDDSLLYGLVRSLFFWLQEDGLLEEFYRRFLWEVEIDPSAVFTLERLCNTHIDGIDRAVKAWLWEVDQYEEAS